MSDLPEDSSDDGDATPFQAREDFLVFEDVNKFFGSHHVLRDISLEVSQGEILALLGPSGSGKTTLLRTLAGFEPLDWGRILVDGEEVQQLPAAKRDFGMVFQSYALFPHLTVESNIAFGLEVQKRSATEAAVRVSDLLQLVDLEGFEGRRIGEISGGQQQRVSLARALAPEPRVLMLDEPLSNLDPSLRERTRRILRQLLKDTGVTTVLVTHEQEEAFELGDRVAVLNDGRLEQVATPEELYSEPATRFVATFVGRTSLLQGVVEEIDDRHARVRLLGEGSEIGVADWWTRSHPDLEQGAAVDVAVRPEGLRFAEGPEGGALPGIVVARRYTGPLTYFVVRLELGAEVELAASPDAARVGDRVHVTSRTLGLPRLFARERET